MGNEEQMEVDKSRSLLQILKDHPINLAEFVDFINETKGKNKIENSAPVKEAVCDLSRPELNELWAGLQRLSTDALLLIADDSDAGTDEVAVGVKAIKTVLSIVSVTLNGNEDHVPQGLTSTMCTYHDLLLSVAGRNGDIGKQITGVCEKWWTMNFPSHHLMVSNSLLYMLQLCLDQGGTQVIVKRLWDMKDSLLLYNFEPRDNMPCATSQLKRLLLLTPRCSVFLKSEQGKKFMSFIFSLNYMTEAMHVNVKEVLPGSSKIVARDFGDVYVRTWRSIPEEKRKIFEEECIQNLMYLAIHVSSTSMVQMLKNFFWAFETKKEIRQLDTMLYRLLEPFIWRSLTTPNGQIRCNACGLFLSLFPFRAADMTAEETEIFWHKQCDAIKDLLEDQCPPVRLIAIQGTSRICYQYWDTLPRTFLKDFFKSLIETHAFDVTSADIRAAVYQGLKGLVDNPGSHKALEKTLPKLMLYGINDHSEKVRISAVNVLLALKGLGTLKFWNFVSVDDLLARLAVERSRVVMKAITEVLMSSYCPLKKGLDDRVHRTRRLVKSNWEAARKFYVYVENFVTLEYAVEQITALVQAVYMCVRESRRKMEWSVSSPESGLECDESSIGEESTLNEFNKENVSLGVTDASDLDSMAGLLDCAAILWHSVSTKLQDQRYATIRARLHKVAGRVLPCCINFFKEPKIADSLFSMASLLPSSSVQYVSTHVLKRLEALNTEDQNGIESDKLDKGYQSLVQAACSWRFPEFIQMVNDWLDSCLNLNNEKRPSSPARKRKRVKFKSIEKIPPKPRQGLLYLLNLLENQMGRQYLVNEHLHLVEDVCQRLLASKKLLALFLRGEEESEPVLVTKKDLVTCVKLLYMLKCVSIGKKEEREGFMNWLSEEIEWMTMEVLPVLIAGIDTTDSQTTQEQHQIAVNITSKFLTFFQQALLTNVVSEPLVLAVSQFLSQLLPIRSSEFLLVEIAGVIYQVAEWCLHGPKPLQTPNTVCPLIQLLLQSLVARFKNRDIDSNFEFHKDVECAEIVRETLLCVCMRAPRAVADACLGEIFGPLLTACISDLVAAIMRIDVVESPADRDFECPKFTDFLFRLVVQKQTFLVRSLAVELIQCVTIGALSERLPLCRLGGAVQLIYYLQNAKCPRNVVKEACGCVRTELVSLNETCKGSEMFVQIMDIMNALEQ